jgi:hypothetical protein
MMNNKRFNKKKQPFKRKRSRKEQARRSRVLVQKTIRNRNLAFRKKITKLYLQLCKVQSKNVHLSTN